MTDLPSRPEARLDRPLVGRPPGPDPVRLAGLLVRAWLEVRTGFRPLAQLTPLLSPAARRRLAVQLTTGPGEPIVGPPPRVHRLIASSPAPGVREVTVLVEHAGRITAVAVRMERHRGAWRAVEIAAPEAGLAPLATASVRTVRRPRDSFDEAFEEAGEVVPEHLQDA